MSIIPESACEELFRIVKIEEGHYLAVRTSNPRFALFGNTITEAAESGERALAFYRFVEMAQP